MGIEPKEEDLPIELSALTYESQLAFEIYKYLPGRWEGMAGAYLGKDVTILPFLFTHHNVEDNDAPHILFLIQYIDDCVSTRINEKQRQQQELKGAKK